MTDHPILFSGPMVRAILDGRKTMTRRVVRPQPTHEHTFWEAAPGDWFGVDEETKTRGGARRCPYGQPGDRLVVRETWARGFDDDSGRCAESYLYRADYKDGVPLLDIGGADSRWRPAIFMPRAASRIDLEVTAIRVERLQEISTGDVIAEGLALPEYLLTDRPVTVDLVPTFAAGWDHINGKRPGCAWFDDPWVWVIEFRRIRP